MPMVQIVEEPYLFPQRCFFTGDGNPRPILDTGKEDPEYGRIYISLSFMDELAKAAGYTTIEEAQTLRTKIDELEERVAAIPTVIEGVITDVRAAAARAEFNLRGWGDGDVRLGAPVDPESGARPA